MEYATICQYQTETVVRLPIEPFTAPRMVRSDKWARRSCVVSYYDSRNQLYEMGRKILDPLPPAFDVTFHISMPKSWSEKKKREMDGKPHQQIPDRDNLLKAFQDTFCGDDAYIHDGRVRKSVGENWNNRS